MYISIWTMQVIFQTTKATRKKITSNNWKLGMKLHDFDENKLIMHHRKQSIQSIYRIVTVLLS